MKIGDCVRIKWAITIPALELGTIIDNDIIPDRVLVEFLSKELPSTMSIHISKCTVLSDKEFLVAILER